MFEALRSLVASSPKPAAKPQSASEFFKELGEGIAKSISSITEGLYNSVGGATRTDFSQLRTPGRPDERPRLNEQLAGMVRRAQQSMIGTRMSEMLQKLGDSTKTNTQSDQG